MQVGLLQVSAESGLKPLNIDLPLTGTTALDRLMSGPDPLAQFRPDSAYHVVQAGEDLPGIAAAHGSDWQTLARINGIDGPQTIVEGQRLRLPETAPTLQPAADQQVAAPQPVTADQIRQIMPNAGGRADNFADALNSAMTAHGITTTEQRAAFLAQVSVESGDLRNTVENLNYSAQRLTEVWPSRFPTIGSATPYARNAEALANNVYANRLGNGDTASGDGYVFRGRGLMQVTGRDNYRAAGHEADPESLAEPQTAADTAAGFWANNGLNGRTQAELGRAEFNAVSRTVNGGNHGSNERWAAYQRGLEALRAPQ